MCIQRTTERLSSGPEMEGLAVRNPTQMAGCLAGLDPCCFSSAASAASDVRPFSRERFPVGYIQSDQDNGSGWSNANQGNVPQKNQRGQELYCTCRRWHYGAAEAEKMSQG